MRKTDEDISQIAKTVVENLEDQELQNAFVGLVLQLLSSPPRTGDEKANASYRVLEQSLKIPFVAATVLLVNVQKTGVTQEVLEKCVTALQENINLGAWREVKLILRFLACLQGLLEGDGVFPVLEELFSRAVDLQTASSEDVGRPAGSRRKMLINY